MWTLGTVRKRDIADTNGQNKLYLQGDQWLHDLDKRIT